MVTKKRHKHDYGKNARLEARIRMGDEACIATLPKGCLYGV